MSVSEYERLLREQHALIAARQGDSPEAEAIADQMDRPWLAMTEEEQRQMRRLSAELHDAAASICRDHANKVRCIINREPIE